MDYQAYYTQLKFMRDQIIILRDNVLELQKQWAQHKPLPNGRHTLSFDCRIKLGKDTILQF